MLRNSKAAVGIEVEESIQGLRPWGKEGIASKNNSQARVLTKLTTRQPSRRAVWEEPNLKYDGAEPPKAWLHRLKHLKQIHGYNDKEIIYIAERCLNGSAQVWFRIHQPKSVDSLRTGLHTRFASGPVLSPSPPPRRSFHSGSVLSPPPPPRTGLLSGSILSSSPPPRPGFHSDSGLSPPHQRTCFQTGSVLSPPPLDRTSLLFTISPNPGRNIRSTPSPMPSMPTVIRRSSSSENRNSVKPAVPNAVVQWDDRSAALKTASPLPRKSSKFSDSVPSFRCSSVESASQRSQRSQGSKSNGCGASEGGSTRRSDEDGRGLKDAVTVSGTKVGSLDIARARRARDGEAGHKSVDTASFSLSTMSHRISARDVLKENGSRSLPDSCMSLSTNWQEAFLKFKYAIHQAMRGDWTHMSSDFCKYYLRCYSMRTSGSKRELIHRIRDHLELTDGSGADKYPRSSFVIDCAGVVCLGDVILFEQKLRAGFDVLNGNQFDNSIRTVVGRVVKKTTRSPSNHQVFTVEVYWSKGQQAFRPMRPICITDKDLFSLQPLRQIWINEDARNGLLDESKKSKLERLSSHKSQV